MEKIIYIVIALLFGIKHNGKFFEAGEVFSIEKEEGLRLIELGAAKKVSDKELPDDSEEPDDGDGDDDDDDDDGDDDDINVADMTVDEIKQELTLLGVGFKAKASKDELINLYNAAKDAAKEQ